MEVVEATVSTTMATPGCCPSPTGVRTACSLHGMDKVLPLVSTRGAKLHPEECAKVAIKLTPADHQKNES